MHDGCMRLAKSKEERVPQFDIVFLSSKLDFLVEPADLVYVDRFIFLPQSFDQ